MDPSKMFGEMLGMFGAGGPQQMQLPRHPERLHAPGYAGGNAPQVRSGKQKAKAKAKRKAAKKARRKKR